PPQRSPGVGLAHVVVSVLVPLVDQVRVPRRELSVPPRPGDPGIDDRLPVRGRLQEHRVLEPSCQHPAHTAGPRRYAEWIGQLFGLPRGDIDTTGVVLAGHWDPGDERLEYGTAQRMERDRPAQRPGLAVAGRHSSDRSG